MKVTLRQLKEDSRLYFERCFKIRDKQKRIVPLAMKPQQLRLQEAIERERRNGRLPRIIVLKSRQTGFSTLIQANLFRSAHLWSNTQSLVLAHKIESAEYLFKMSRRAYENLPEPLRFKTRYSSKRMIEFKDNGSSIQVEVAGESRGFTANEVHLSEFAFYEDPETVFTAIMQTVPEDPSGLVIIESTANGVGNLFHELYVLAKQGKNDFVAFFSPWFEEPTYTRRADFTASDLNEYERGLVSRFGVTLDQIAWYRHTLANKCKGDHDVMRQEYPSDDIEAFLFSGREVFDRDALRGYADDVEKMEAEGTLAPQCEVEPTRVKGAPNIVVVERGRWRIYRKREGRQLYTMGIDSSEGDSQSDICSIVVLNQHTLNVDAEFYGKTPPELLAIEACTVGWMYDAKANPEINNHGHTVVYAMQEHGYRNFYYRQTTNDGTGKPTNKIGFDTRELSRTFLYNAAREYVRMRAGRIESPTIVRAMLVARYDERNRVDHPKGEYLDPLTAFGLALVAHKEHPDATLAPLAPREQEVVRATLHKAMRYASIGKKLDNVDLFGLTQQQALELDMRAAKRERHRSKSGIAGAL